jgi:hypothetical protein
MFPPNSRYASTPTVTVTLPDGRVVVCLLRRFLPDTSALATMTTHITSSGERLDTVAAQFLGDPALWWRVADANPATIPPDATLEPGITLRITFPEGIPGPADA